MAKLSIRRFFYIISSIIILLLIYNYQLIGYGWSQGTGQLKIIWNAKPIEEMMADENFPDSLKASLNLVSEIKAFATDSLGIKPSDNYTTVYDQQGKEILWVVTACNRYAFDPLIWKFPIIGSFTYKGFFDYDKAIGLARKLKNDGYDVELRSVSGWSTLGWFKDPILSNMLAESPGELASTIIHELTHGTLFVPDSMTFNENLATFIGNQGALQFLKTKYGDTSEAYQNFKIRRIDSQRFTNYIVVGAIQLDSLYNQMASEPDSIKELRKIAFIDRIIEQMDTVGFIDSLRYQAYFKDYRPNNAYFVSFLNYRERQTDFTVSFQDNFNSDLSQFVNYWKEQYKN